MDLALDGPYALRIRNFIGNRNTVSLPARDLGCHLKTLLSCCAYISWFQFVATAHLCAWSEAHQGSWH